MLPGLLLPICAILVSIWKVELREQEGIILWWMPLGNKSEALKISGDTAKKGREFAGFLHLPFLPTKEQA